MMRGEARFPRAGDICREVVDEQNGLRRRL